MKLPWLIRAASAALVALAAGIAAPALAHDCRIPGPDSVEADWELRLNVIKLDCLGVAGKDPAEVVQRFERLTNQPVVMSQSERLVKAVEALTAVAEERAAGPLQRDEWAAMLAELRDVRRQLLTLPEAQSKAGWLQTVSRAIPPKWRRATDDTASVRVGGTELRFLADIGCTSRAACPQFQSQIDLLRLAVLMARLAGYAQSPSLADHHADAQLAFAQWEAYRTKGLHQYVWEVWANGRLMDRRLCPEDAGSGMKMGFCQVPSQQLVLLHPEVMLRYSNTADHSSQLRPALAVELLGWHRWRWKTVDGRDSAEMEGRWGASLAAAYTRTDREDRWSFGPLLHLGDYAFAVTKASGGRWSLVLNTGLADRYFGRRQQAVEELQRVRKAGLADLLLN